MMSQVLVVSARGEAIALELERVLEVLALGDLTPVPTAPAAVRGLINLRGQLVPVVDLAAALGAPPSDPTAGATLVLVEAPSIDDVPALRAALIVDRVLGLGPAAARDPRPVQVAALLAELRRGPTEASA